MMKILCLYNNDCALELFEWLRSSGHDIILSTERLSAQWCRKECFDLTVSYTYRYILSADILAALNNNVVNMHNSFLPWNRGADPNIWSYLDNTPRGVTLHYMDAKLDQGYIIAQMLVNDSADETLSSSYKNLDKAAKQLFKDAFKYYDKWLSMRKKAIDGGSYHSLNDGVVFKSLIRSYDMKVADLKDLYNRAQIEIDRGGGINKIYFYSPLFTYI